MNSAVHQEVQQAATALRENRVNDAIHQLQAALAQAPDDFAANHLLGVALGKAGRRPEAIARLLKATQLNPGHAAAQTHLGLAYAAVDHAEQARHAFESALQADPNFAPAQAGLSRLPAAVPNAPAVASPLDPLLAPPAPPMPTVTTTQASPPSQTVPSQNAPSTQIPNSVTGWKQTLQELLATKGSPYWQVGGLISFLIIVPIIGIQLGSINPGDGKETSPLGNAFGMLIALPIMTVILIAGASLWTFLVSYLSESDNILLNIIGFGTRFLILPALPYILGVAIFNIV